MDSTPSASCPHILELWQDHAASEQLVAKYKSVVTWSSCRAQAVRPSKRRRIAAPVCGTCHLALYRPFACLSCEYTGCWTDHHTVKHLQDKGHPFCVDPKTGFVFCRTCNDFIYDSRLDQLHLSTTVQAEEKQTKFQSARKQREPFVKWSPSDKDVEAMDGVEAAVCQGRRGLLNLGQTCFMNAILQCLIHNPLLRNYYLSDKHNSKQCKFENCTSCEMDKLFAEVYSDSTIPYGPITFLAITWKASAELSGYAQHDAHEFFISTLNQMHSTSKGHTNVSCNCVIHSTFAGQLQSDVKCERCHNITTTVDPMLDISLELKGGENTLATCLKRFTQPEKLDSREYTCSKCGKNPHEASKRLTIRTLPPVLSFQFKRFEHKTSDKSNPRKMDAPIRFPAVLNMAPYTSLAVSETEKENSTALTTLGPEAMYEYELFAVINHEGQIDNGHYTNFARFGDEWYRFDDDKVTHTTLGACLSSAAYMCFYVKRRLDYKPYTLPSYVVSRSELQRAKDLEREKELKAEKEKEAQRVKELEEDLLSMV